MNELVVCSAAEAEYADALSWYSERSVQGAERFDAEFDQALETIASDPERFPRCDERHHYYLMRHFPYQLIFHWVVIAVAHTHESHAIGRRDSVFPSNTEHPQGHFAITFALCSTGVPLVKSMEKYRTTHFNLQQESRITTSCELIFTRCIGWPRSLFS